MQSVLLIGDSICMGYSAGPGYRPFVADQLGSRGVRVSAMYCSDSGTLVKKIPEVARSGPFDVIHLNCGLHDLKRNRQTLEYITHAEAYGRNLETLFERLRQDCARLIWATTTPVCDEWHQRHKPFDRSERDVLRYNAISLSSATAGGLVINDLHRAIMNFGIERAHHDDGVHFNEAGSRLLAAAVADAILACS
jgi:isoamyl acetate esterase